MAYEIVPISKIQADVEQPRKNFDAQDLNRLIESIREHGIRNPLIVEKFPNGTYLLEDGERRYRAALELGLKEVPVITNEPKDAVTRLITQFHLQEQHKGWTAAEKAVATLKLAQELKMDPKQVGKLLAINDRAISQYIALASIINKKAFENDELPLQLAERMSGVNRTVAAAYKANEETFTREDQKALEHAIITRVKHGEINSKGDVSKIADIARTNLPEFKKFIKSDKADLEETFAASSAKGYRIAKNLLWSIGFLRSNTAKAIALNSGKYYNESNKAQLKLLIAELETLRASIG